MEKGMKQNIILLVLVTLLLLANIIYAICQSIDFEIQNMILDNKKQIDELKGEIENVN